MSDENAIQGTWEVINPTTELNALQGPWNIVRVEKGDATDRLWGKDFLTVGRRFHFDGADLKIPNIGQVYFAMYACSVGSNAFPRWIDLHQSKDNLGGLFALGVYEIKGDQLKLCLAKCESSRGHAAAQVPCGGTSFRKCPAHSQTISTLGGRNGHSRALDGDHADRRR